MFQMSLDYGDFFLDFPFIFPLLYYLPYILLPLTFYNAYPICSCLSIVYYLSHWTLRPMKEGMKNMLSFIVESQVLMTILGVVIPSINFLMLVGE